jgi:hypothetical protein
MRTFAPEGEPVRRGWKRSPVLAVSVLLASLWLIWEMRLDVAYFASSPAPIDLGGPGDLHLDRARPNRFVRVSGPLVGAVPGVEGSAGERRRVSGLFGTNLIVDRPAAASPTTVYEGRLLPSSRRADYAAFAAELGKQGWTAGDKFMVLREGERPRARYREPLIALALVALASFNGAYLVRPLFSWRRT